MLRLVLRLVLVPQATRAMLPVIVGQLVVLLKDTALGYLVAYPERLARALERRLAPGRAGRP